MNLGDSLPSDGKGYSAVEAPVKATQLSLWVGWKSQSSGQGAHIFGHQDCMEF